MTCGRPRDGLPRETPCGCHFNEVEVHSASASRRKAGLSLPSGSRIQLSRKMVVLIPTGVTLCPPLKN